MSNQKDFEVMKYLKLAIIWVIFAPVLVFIIGMYLNKETGQIGDTIGGMTAPAIGLVSAWLVYRSFKEQINANVIANKGLEDSRAETNFIYLNSEFDKIKKKTQDFIDQFVYGDYKDSSKEQFETGINDYMTAHSNEKVDDMSSLTLERVKIAMTPVHRILDENEIFIRELTSMSMSEEQKEMLSRKYLSFFYEIQNSELGIFERGLGGFKVNYNDENKKEREIASKVWDSFTNYESINRVINQWLLAAERKASNLM